MADKTRMVHWGELTTRDFAGLDPEAVIAVLPVAAVEQHGPHLPVATDTLIAEGMIAETIRRLPEDVQALFLPVQSIGKSNEHIRSPGTLTLDAAAAIRAWTEIGESVHRAGVRKLVLVNAHGGNVDMLPIIARELRVRCEMLVVCCSWMRLGYPPGVFAEQEIAHGLHGGDIETSLMLHFRPDLVRREAIANFEPASVEMAREFKVLRASGPSAFAWLAQDLHASGATGDATRGTAEKGRLCAEYQAGRFVDLLEDVSRFQLSRLAARPPSNT